MYVWNDDRHRWIVSASIDRAIGSSIRSEKVQFGGLKKMLSVDQQRRSAVHQLIDGPSVVSSIEDAFLDRHSLLRTPFNLGIHYYKKG